METKNSFCFFGFDDSRPLKNPRAAAALAKAEAKQIAGELDLSSWPEQWWPWLRKIVDLWELSLPTDKGDFAAWLVELERLRTACGEFGLDLLDDIMKSYLDNLKPTRPAGLVRVAIATAGNKRLLLADQEGGWAISKVVSNE